MVINPNIISIRESVSYNSNKTQWNIKKIFQGNSNNKIKVRVIMNIGRDKRNWIMELLYNIVDT